MQKLPQPPKTEAIFDTVKSAIDEAAVSTIADLDILIRQIEMVKQAVLEHAANMKQELNRHFDFAVEASAWGENIRKRLLTIAEGETPYISPSNGRFPPHDSLR